MLAILASLAAVAAPSTPFAPTPAQQTAIADVERRGRDIYDFDQAAWVTTDTMLKAIPDPGKAGVRGWIVERDGDRLVAIYYRLDGATPRKVYVAHASGRAVLDDHVLAAGDDDRFNAVELRMIEARRIVLDQVGRAGVRPCTPGRMNTVVLPPSADDTVSVYLLSSQRTATTFPAGGHFRFDVNAAGTIAGQRGFTKSCIELDPNRQAPPGAKAAAAFITHLLDPQPTEIHVWLSLLMGNPLFVGTVPSQELWAIAGGIVRPV